MKYTFTMHILQIWTIDNNGLMHGATQLQSGTKEIAQIH